MPPQPLAIGILSAAQHLSGRELPPRHLMMQIAETLGTDAAAAERRWVRNATRQRNARARTAACAPSGPPPGLRTYADLLRALRDLLRARGTSQRELARRDHRLSRSTVGAVLRAERSARPDMVIVRACGASAEAEQAWASAWRGTGRPHQVEQHRRRREGYEYMIRAERMNAPWR